VSKQTGQRGLLRYARQGFFFLYIRFFFFLCFFLCVSFVLFSFVPVRLVLINMLSSQEGGSRYLFRTIAKGHHEAISIAVNI